MMEAQDDFKKETGLNCDERKEEYIKFLEKHYFNTKRSYQDTLCTNT